MKTAIVSCFALLLAAQAHAQIAITAQSPTSFASAIQSSAADQATLDSIGTKAPTVTLGGVTFSLIANPVSFSLTSSMSASVAYLGKDSIDTNYFGVASGAISTTLYAPFSSASKSVAYDFKSAAATTFSFFTIDNSFGGVTEMQSNPTNFLIYEANVSGTVYDLLAIDDRGTEYVDYNDGLFLLQRNPGAVPEPSTYGLMSASALLALVAYRRRKAARA